MKHLFFLFLIFLSFFSVATERDTTYVKNIRTVQLYTASSEESDNKQVLNPAVSTVNGNPLTIEFDVLEEYAPSSFMFQVFHCSKKWTISDILTSEFLDEFNEFMSYDIVPSSTRGVQYYHCKANLPKLKLSGNYILHILSEDGDILLKRRFLIVKNQLSIQQLINATTSRISTQELSFTATMPVSFPFDFMDFTSVAVRKNWRWDTFRMLKKPSFINQQNKEIRFNSAFNNTVYPSCSEFYTVDIRNEASLGIGVQNIIRKGDTMTYLLYENEFKPNTYFSRQDINGQFIIDQYQYGDGQVNGEYTKAIFSLNYSLPITGKAYVMGGFNNWKKEKSNELHFNPSTRNYQATIPLKQGYYNYAFELEKPNGQLDEGYFMGNFPQTENVYEIIVYYYNEELQTEEIIGYKQVKSPFGR